MSYGRNDRSEVSQSSRSCWTCKVRRKKCDGRSPICETCAGLQITCFRDDVKPDWMDGGSRQEEMAARLKHEVKENAHRRRSINTSATRSGTIEQVVGEWTVLPQRPLPVNLQTLHGTLRDTDTGASLSPLSTVRHKEDCVLASTRHRPDIAFERSDTILMIFYLEELLPFLYPFYQPSILQGGRAWILEMMISSPVVRQATLCQSSYFLSLARGTTSHHGAWETVLTQTRNAFDMLRQSLRVIEGADIAEHLHGAVRIMASIIQLQRFEIAIKSYNNCQPHLTAAVILFKQLLDSCFTSAGSLLCPSSKFDTVISRLGPSWNLSGQDFHVPSAEQAAFRFSTALLLLDDIIASTVLCEKPMLYEYHNSLLGNFDGCEPTINLGDVVGCQNWALLQIGEIAALDVWKHQCRAAGDLDVIQLVHRATIIKESLETHLTELEELPMQVPLATGITLNVYKAEHSRRLPDITDQVPVITHVWAHAALLYLSVVVSGWQPSSVDVRFHVGKVIELLRYRISTPALLRTMVWPFCVTGCLAEAPQEPHLRNLATSLQFPSVFGPVHKALEIMENVWRVRETGHNIDHDLAACFKGYGDLVLLV